MLNEKQQQEWGNLISQVTVFTFNSNKNDLKPHK